MYSNDYTYYDYNQTSSIANNLVAASMFSIVVLIIGLIMGIISIVSMWKIFKKAGKNGWEAIIPIYNMIVLLEIVSLPVWYIVLFFVPIANIYAMFKIYIELAHKFGKSTGFGVASVFFSFICMPILAFSDATYNGNSSTQTQNNIVNQSNMNYQSNTNLNQQNANMQSNVDYQNNVSSNQPTTGGNQNIGYQDNTSLNQQNTNTQSNVDYQNSLSPNQPTTSMQPNMGYQNNVNLSQGDPSVQNPGVNNQQINSQSGVNTQQSSINQTVVPSSEQQNLSESKVCPKCGNKVSTNSDTCFMCGYKF